MRVEEIERGRYKIIERRGIVARIWNKVTTPSEMERALLARNKRHLQQIATEQGVSERGLIKQMRENEGVNETATAILDGSIILDKEMSE